MNPLMKLVKLLRTINANPNEYISINSDGSGFIFKSTDDLIAAINGSSTLSTLNATKINNQDIETFINGLKSEFTSHEHSNKIILDSITSEKINEWNSKQDAIGFTPEDASKKGAVNGFASLDDTGRIPIAQLPAITKETIIVDDNDALNNITSTTAYPGLQVLVLDDDTVKPNEQSVLYICIKITGTVITWAPIARMDPKVITVTWDSIIDKPSSDASDIDIAVTDSHTHSNNTVINKLSEDTEERPLYNGRPLAISNGTIGAIKSFTIKSTQNGTSTFIINEPSFTAITDKILSIYYSGLKIASSDYTFQSDTNTLTLLNGLAVDSGELLEVEFEKF